MNWIKCALLGAILFGASLSAEDKLTVDTRAYPIGAWFGRHLESYSLGRFTAIPYRKTTKEYAAEHDMFLVASCGWWGMPPAVRKELIANTGMKVSKVGLFLNHNFNYPEFRTWWYKRVKEIIGEVDRPGKIFACKIGNEFGYHSWPEFYDYTQWTIDRYHDYLKQEYKSIAELNKRWRSGHKSFQAIDPPRDIPTDDMANWIQWRQFTCWNFAEFFRNSGTHVKQVLKSIPVSDNFYLTSPMHGWNDFELARQTDYLAYDIYDIPHWDSLRFRLDVLRCAAKAYDKPAYLLEYHGGPNHRIHTVSGRDIDVESFMAIARDVRAIMYFRWAPGSRGREQGIHGLCDSNFGPTERTTAAAEFVSECQRLAPHLLKSRTDPDVAILYSVASQFYCYGKTRRDWAPVGRLREVYHMLNLAQIESDFIEPRQIDRGDLKKYKVLVLAGPDVLATSRVRIVEEFVKSGGVLVVHAPLPAANELGLSYAANDPTVAKVTGIQHPPRPEPAKGRTVTSSLTTAKAELPEKATVYRSTLAKEFKTLAKTDVPILASRVLGKGKVIFCSLECLPPGRWPKEPVLRSVAELYGAMMGQEAKVLPKATLDAKDASCDIRCLTSGTNTLVFVTNLGEGSIAASTLTVRTSPCKAAFLVTAGSRQFRRVDCKSAAGSVDVKLPEIPAAAIVFLAREGQPVPGMICPEKCVPGQSARVTATLDNLSNVSVSGEAMLAAPTGWQVKAVKTARFANVKPFGRASIAFDVTVPKEAAFDRWRVHNLIRSSFKIDQAGGKSLSCEQGIAVLPPVDFRLTYENGVINPWQELTPPLMRWGFNTDVLTPLHQPLAVAATVPVRLGVIPNLKLGKGTIDLACDGIITKPSRIALDLSAPSTHTVRMTANEVVDYELAISYAAGARQGKTMVPIEVTVGRATVQAACRTAAKSRDATAMTPIAIGNERGSLPAAVVATAVRGAAPQQLRDETGRDVPFAFAEGELTFSCDLPAGKARTFLLDSRRPVERLDTRRGMSWERTDPRIVKVTAPGYSFEYDSMTGTLRHLRLRGCDEDLLAQMDTYATSQEEGRIRKSAFGPSRRFAVSANNAQVNIESEGPMGDLKTTKTIAATPGRIDVTIKVANRSNAPVDVAELGCMFLLNSRMYDHWTRDNPDGEPISGTLPRGFGLSKPPRWQDFHDDAGAGLALLPVSNAMLTSWQEGYRGIRHGGTGTFLVFMRGLKISPKDVTQSKFSLIVHRKPIDLRKLGEPALVIATGEADAP